MIVNLTGMLSVAATAAAFIATWNLTKNRKPAIRAAFLSLSILLSLPSLLFAVYYLRILPEWAWFYTLRSWPGSEFLALFVGCAGGCVAAFLPRLLMGFPLFAAMAIAAVPYLKPILSPLPDEIFAEQWQDSVCLQSTPSTCGPASVCTILKSFGVESSEQKIARTAFSYTGGTEAWYLARFARGMGCTPRFDFRNTFATDVALPALVGVHRGRMGHFIAVLALDGDRVTLADPLKGREQLSLADFRKRYDFTGFHLSILAPR